MSRGRGWVVAMAVLAAASSGAIGCSLVLDFGGDITDAGVDDDAGGGDGGADLCDVAEPNDSQADAEAIEVGTFDAAICPAGDKDFYAFTVDGTQDVTVEIRFDNMGGFGDLELFLYAEGGAEIDRSTLFGDIETIAFTEADQGRLAAGTYAAEVRAFNSQRENTYTFQLDVSAPIGPDAGVADAGIDGGM